MSVFEDIKEAARARTAKINSLWWWLFGKSPEEAKVTASGGARLGSGLWRLLTRSPKLIRRGVQGVVIYAITYVAEKLLDKAHEEYPHSEFIAKADAVAHGAMKVENFLITGATSMAKDLYDAIPAEAAPQKVSEAPQTTSSPLPEELTKAVTPIGSKEIPSVTTPEAIKTATESTDASIAIPQVSAGELQPPIGKPISLTPPNSSAGVTTTSVATAPVAPVSVREASFMPVETGQRNRANLNAALAVPVQCEPPAPAVPSVPATAPDNLPEDGGYDPATEITWGPYAKPFGRPVIIRPPAPYLSPNFHHFPRR